MLHPATAHFAMVLPVVTAGFAVWYLVKKDAMASKLTNIMLLITALAMIGVWYTGTQAAPLIADYLSSAGKHELFEHRDLGIYLAIGFALIATLKLIGYKLKNFAIEAVAVLLLLIGVLATFIQGKHGGEVVYNYGMPFKAYMIEDTLKDAIESANEAEEDAEKVEAYEDAIDDIKSISEEVDKIYGEEEETEKEE